MKRGGLIAEFIESLKTLKFILDNSKVFEDFEDFEEIVSSLSTF